MREASKLSMAFGRVYHASEVNMNINPTSSVDSKHGSSVSSVSVTQKNGSQEGNAGEVTGFLDKLTALLFGSKSGTQSDDADITALASHQEEALPEFSAGEDATQASVTAPLADGEMVLAQEGEESEAITTTQVMSEGDELLERLQQANQTLVTASGKNLPSEENELVDFSAAQKLNTPLAESKDLTSGEPVSKTFHEAKQVRTESQAHHEQNKSVAQNGLASLASAASSSQPVASTSEANLAAAQAGAISMPELAQSQSAAAMDPNVLKAALSRTMSLGKEKESASPTAGSEQTFAQQLASTAGQSSASQSLGSRNELAPVQGQPVVLTLNKEMVADEMAERVQMMMSKNLKNIDIRLDPPELGRMHIRMNMHGDGTSVQFTVSNMQARDALEQSMPRLREMLAQQGVQLADTSVQQQNSGQQQGYAAERDESGRSGGREPLLGDDNLDTHINLDLNVATKRDGISYYA